MSEQSLPENSAPDPFINPNKRLAAFLNQLSDDGPDEAQRASLASEATHITTTEVFERGEKGPDSTVETTPRTVYTYTDPETGQAHELNESLARTILGYSPAANPDAAADTPTSPNYDDDIEDEPSDSQEEDGNPGTITFSASEWRALKAYIATVPHINPELLVRYTNSDRTREVFPNLPRLNEYSSPAVFEVLQGRGTVDKITNVVRDPRAGIQSKRLISPHLPEVVRKDESKTTHLIRRTLGRNAARHMVEYGALMQERLGGTPNIKTHEARTEHIAEVHRANRAAMNHNAGLDAWEQNQQWQAHETEEGAIVITPRNPDAYSRYIEQQKADQEQVRAAELAATLPRMRGIHEYPVIEGYQYVTGATLRATGPEYTKYFKDEFIEELVTKIRRNIGMNLDSGMEYDVAKQTAEEDALNELLPTEVPEALRQVVLKAELVAAGLIAKRERSDLRQKNPRRGMGSK